MLFIIMTSSITSQSSRDLMIVDDYGTEETRSDRLAIVVGINKYSPRIGVLDYAVPDARLIKNTLEDKGNFSVRYYADDDYDKSAKYPDKINIMKALNDARNAASNGWVKTLVVYFAGHGIEIGGTHYLVPIDVYPRDLEDSCINLDEVISILNDAKTRSKVILFLDACRKDPSSKNSGKARGGSGIWKSDINSRGLAIFRSASSGERSWEIPKYGHGVYTYFLNKGLKGEADDDGDGFVSYAELAHYVWRSMMNWSNTNGDDRMSQMPESKVIDQYGEFFITHYRDGEIIPNELRGVKYRDMVHVDGGTFTQKRNKGDSFRHTISSFEIGKYEVTYELWYAVYKWAIKHGYHFANAGMEGSVTGGGDWPNYNNIGKRPTSSKYEPVTMVNWRDCIVWCNAYSEILGYTPVYNSNGYVLKDSRDSNGDNCDNVIVNWSGNGYRLPTEGEWQYAATDRGNTPWNYASGASDDWENSSACDRVAWYGENSGGKTHPVGGKSSNGLGVYDMSGNVWEWCWDRKGKHPSNSRTDYRGSSAGSRRVGRGGGWYYNPDFLRVGCRGNYRPYDEGGNLGFRLVRGF